MNPFAYPKTPHTRKHGPRGYADYSEYRDWVRDEFTFRCVFCLRREVWLGSSTFLHLDHAISQHEAPNLKTEYDNLVYLCACCNGHKQSYPLPNPCSIALADCLEVNSDGTVNAKNMEGRRLVRVLRLDSKDQIDYRRKVIALREDPAHKRDWFCYPRDLPDLRKRRPPQSNTRPEGADNCYFAKRERGELEEIY